jgi:hypothetical protein
MAHTIGDKTGRAMGTLEPVIYWEKSSPTWFQGVYMEKHILMPPTEIGDRGALARQLWTDSRHGRPSYKDQGYVWCEAGTLQEVQKLQQRMIDQENKILQHQGRTDAATRERVHKETASRLRQKMASSSTTPYEREFIRLWLEMSDKKQDEYTKRFTERNMYLQALEFDSNHKLEDRIGGGV